MEDDAADDDFPWENVPNVLALLAKAGKNLGQPEKGTAARLVTVEELAAAIQIPVKSVYTLCAQGLPGVRRFGRTIRIDLEEALKGMPPG